MGIREDKGKNKESHGCAVETVPAIVILFMLVWEQCGERPSYSRIPFPLS
jgi:hypothetical protein